MLSFNHLIAIVNLPLKLHLMVLAIFLLREGELLDPPVGASLGPKQNEIYIFTYKVTLRGKRRKIIKMLFMFKMVLLKIPLSLFRLFQIS